MRSYVCWSEGYEASILVSREPSAAAGDYAEILNNSSGGALFEDPDKTCLDVFAADAKTGEVTKYHVRGEVEVSFYAEEM